MPVTVAELALSNGVIHVDGRLLTKDLTLSLGKSEAILAGWDILHHLVDGVLSMDCDESREALVAMVDAGRVVDLRLAASLYRSALGERDVRLSQSDYGSSVSDAMWVVEKVGAGVLARFVRGVFAAQISHWCGLPVDMDEISRFKREMVLTGNTLADLLQDDCPDIWKKRGEIPEQDRFGLPVMNEGVARDEVVRRIFKECLKMVDPKCGLSNLASAFPGVDFLQRLVRFRRLKRDLKRISDATDCGEMQCRVVEVNNMLHTGYFGPNLEEAAVRRLVRSKKWMWQVDFSELLLVLAREYIRKQSVSPVYILHDCEMLADFGRVCNGPRTLSAKSARKLGFAMLCGMVLDESVTTCAIRVFGYKRGPSMKGRIAKYRENIAKHYGDAAMRDVWKRSVGDSLDANLAEGWRNLVVCPANAKPEHVVYSVVMFGHEPLGNWPEAVTSSVWLMLSEFCHDITVVDMIKGRKHGPRLFHALFNHSAETPDGKLLSRCDRTEAGMWSVFTPMHEAMREMGWMLLRDHATPLIGIAGQEVIFEGCDCLDADGVGQLAIAAIKSCTGGIDAPVLVTSTKRWR